MVQVTLKNENPSGTGLGFVLRGGHDQLDSMKSRPLVVSYVRPQSAVDSEGTVKIGDRLIAAGNTRLDSATLQEALEICQKELFEKFFEIFNPYSFLRDGSDSNLLRNIFHANLFQNFSFLSFMTS